MPTQGPSPSALRRSGGVRQQLHYCCLPWPLLLLVEKALPLQPSRVLPLPAQAQTGSVWSIYSSRITVLHATTLCLHV